MDDLKRFLLLQILGNKFIPDSEHAVHIKIYLGANVCPETTVRAYSPKKT